MSGSNVDVSKGLVNGPVRIIMEITRPRFRRDQMYNTDLVFVPTDFGEAGLHIIVPKSIPFPAKYSYGAVEKRMLQFCFIISYHSTQDARQQFRLCGNLSLDEI